MQAEAQDSSPRITAHHPGMAAAAPAMRHPGVAWALPLPAPLPVVPSAAASAYRPSAAAPAAEPAEVAAPMQHLLVVQHGAGEPGGRGLAAWLGCVPPGDPGTTKLRWSCPQLLLLLAPNVQLSALPLQARPTTA